MTRLSVNIDEATGSMMRIAARHHGISHTEVVRRAVALYSLMDEAVAEGKTIHLKRGGLDWEVQLIQDGEADRG